MTSRDQIIAILEAYVDANLGPSYGNVRLKLGDTTNKGTMPPSRESTVDVRLKLGDSWPIFSI